MVHNPCKYNKSMKTECPNFDCNRPEKDCCTMFRKITIPAVLGDDSEDSEVAPCNGAYRNAIVEYKANMARQGAFEIVLPMLDAINTIASNRADGLEQFVQSLLVLKNVDVDSDQYKELLRQGGLLVPSDGDAKYLTQELNQTQTQTLVDYMYQTVLTICGMPSTSGGNTSDSSNNGAVILKNGWQSAEARAKDTELLFKKSERRFLKIAMSIANIVADDDFNASSIEIRFTRRNYENLQEKAQVLLQMLSSDKIHPRLAFAHCGMFADPEVAYTASMEYEKQRQAEAEAELEEYRKQVGQSSERNTSVEEIVTERDDGGGGD